MNSLTPVPVRQRNGRPRPSMQVEAPADDSDGNPLWVVAAGLALLLAFLAMMTSG